MNSSKRGGVYGFKLQSLDIVSVAIVTIKCVCRDISQLKSTDDERVMFSSDQL